MSQTITINATDLDVSKMNARSKHSPEAIAKMAASIKAVGVINAPSVVDVGAGKYEVVAGRLRMAGAIAAGEKKLDVRLIDATEQADLVEISLAENLTREEMDDLETFVAMNKLATAGKSVKEIAATFSMKELEVRQSLAIGSLPKAIINLAYQDKIYHGALKALTVATKAQLSAWLKIPLRNRPRSGWDIENWLQKDGMRIPIANALFDASAYSGVITDDLFAEADTGKCFNDAEQFWKLQEPIIQALHAELEKQGWTVERVESWRDHDHHKVTKGKGGKAYLVVRPNGQVETCRGFLPHSQKGTSSKSAKSKTPTPQPELSGPMQDYMRAHRHLAIQDGLTNRHDIALAVAVTLIATGARGWRTEQENFGTLRNEKHRPSVKESIHRKDSLDQYEHVYELLGIKTTGAGSWRHDVPKVLETAAEFDTPSLLMMLAALVSERIQMLEFAADPRLDDVIADLMEINQVTEWTPDNTFWSGIRSKHALLGMIGELGTSKDVGALKKGTIGQMRGAVKKLFASRSVNADSWRPGWLKFPATAYAKKHGLNFVSKRK